MNANLYNDATFADICYVMKFLTTIGLEVHIQLNTASKAFCGDANTFGAVANTNISPVSLAYPGTLPVMNAAHLQKAVLLGLAFDCEINKYNYFDRKNYFYPDLPKGYQITQDKAPFCKGGIVRFLHDNEVRTIRLHHIHMEEDAGKSIHDQDEEFTLLDFNRAGVPLLEIVTEPDFSSGAEVASFLAELQRVVQYLDISDANMEEGSFRCDCNVSVRPEGSKALGERCEIKNLNSRKFAKAAVEYEAERQVRIIMSGGKISKTTMLYDTVQGVTLPMRKKESENDYRYFPEPDLPPIVLTDEYLNHTRQKLVQLPLDAYLMLTREYELNSSDAGVLVDNKKWLDYYLHLCTLSHMRKEIAELFILKILPYSRIHNLDSVSLKSEEDIIRFVLFANSGKVSKSAAFQTLFPLWIETPEADPEQMASNLGLIISDDSEIIYRIADAVIDANPAKVKEYLSGKKGLIGFFMGQAKLMSSGKALDPVLLKEAFEQKLK